MGIFNFFIKKIILSKLKNVSNEELIPYLTKEVFETFLNDFETFLTALENDKMHYFIEPSMSYYDSKKKFIYGYILLLKDTYEEDLMWELNLVKINEKSGDFQVLLSISIDDETRELKAPIFLQRKIENIDGGLDKCIQMIKNYSYFNGYKTVPPYVFFSTLIKKPNL